MFIYLLYNFLKWASKKAGDYRNYYKGHMDKIKGEGGGGGGRGVSWGGVEGWGEKAHNCN